MKNAIFTFGLVAIFSCSSCDTLKSELEVNSANDSLIVKADTFQKAATIQTPINHIPDKKELVIDPSIHAKYSTNEDLHEDVISFAKTLIGTPYVYGSTDPAVGFDCSGFINYVYNHFKMNVPRSSVEFTNYGSTVSKTDLIPGDLILFTGTDSTIRVVGHMGIVVNASPNQVQFIHCTSGKMHGVTITDLNNYYQGRFVKFIRIPLPNKSPMKD